MAGTASGIRAGQAFIELGLRDAALEKGLESAEKRLKAFADSIDAIGKKMLLLGTAISTAFLGIAKLFAETGSALSNASVRTGVSVEALSALGYAAAQTGTDLETVESAIRKLQVHLVEAASGSVEATSGFNAMGLSVQRLAQLKPDAQFAIVAQRIGMIRNPTLRAALAVDAFGKSGTALLPMIQNFASLTKEARAFGLIWSKGEVESADRLGHALDLVWQVGKRVVTVIGGTLAPVFKELAMSAARIGKTIIDWVKHNKDLVISIFKITAASVAMLVVGGAAFIALSVAVKGLIFVFAALRVAVVAINTVFAVLTASVHVGALLSAAFTAILSPVGLVTVALVAAGAALFYFSNVGSRALSWLGARFNDLKNDAIKAFNGIADALKAGDIVLAGQILWAALKLEWLKGIASLTQAWSDFSGTLKKIFSDTSFDLARTWTDALAGMKSILAVATAGFKIMWTDFTTFLSKKLIDATNLDPKLKLILQNAVDLNAQGDKNRALGQIPGDLGKIEEDRKNAQGALNDQQRKADDLRHDAEKRAIDAAKAELAKAQANFDALRGKAAGEAKNVTEQDQRKTDQENFMRGLDQAMANAPSNKIDVKGSFSSSARGLGVGDTANEALKVAKQQQEELVKLNRKAAIGKLVFGS